MTSPLEMSKTQVDRLGDRLRKGAISENDLRLLDSYRRSFSNGYESVVRQIRDQLGLEPTGRPAKSTTSITDKLQRESIRLSQMQDIAGCRLTVTDITVQDDVVARLKMLFDKVTIVDRRQHPSHGYRAVHVVVNHSGKLIEIQVRTALQHLWAELSEKLSDVVDPDIKYGGGDEDVLFLLPGMSDSISKLEIAEGQLLRRPSTVNQEDNLPNDIDQQITSTDDIIKMRQSIVELLDAIGEVIPRVKGRKDAISD